MKKNSSSGRGKKQTNHSVNSTFLFNFFFGFLILFLPVFFLPEALDRTLMPRLLALAAFMLPTTLLLTQAKYFHRLDFSAWRKAIFPVFTAYLLIVIITSFFAYNYKESFFDITRTLLFLTTMAIAVVLFTNTENWEDKLPRFFIIAAVIALVVGYIQYIQKVSLSSDELLADGRSVVYGVTGLFSHKNIFAGFLALLLPFTLFGTWKYRGGWQYIAGLVSLLLLIFIVLLRTRSIWVGVAAASFVTMMLLIFVKNFGLPAFWRRIVLAGMVVGIMLIFGIFLLGDTTNEFSVAGRLRSIVDTRSPHNIHRLNTWNSTLKMISDHPVAGVGPGNWNLMITPYFNHSFEEVNQMIWARPHNDFLWIFAEKGIAGITLYVAVFIISICFLLRIILSREAPDNRDRRVFSVLLLAGIIIYLTDSFFSFPYERIEMQVILLIILAAGASMYHKHKPGVPLTLVRKTILIAGLAIFAWSTWFAIETTRMDVHFHKALQALDNNLPEKVLLHARMSKTPLKSIGPTQYPPEYLEGMAYVKMNRHQDALKSFFEAKQLAPGEIRIINRIGEASLASGDFKQAKDYYLHSLKYLPGSETIRKNLATAHYELGEYQLAIEVIKGIENWENDPRLVNNIQTLQTLISRETRTDSIP